MNIADLKVVPIVFLDWQDAFANSGWFGDEELTRWKNELSWACDVGYLLEENGTFLLIAQRYVPPDEANRQNKQWGGVHKIPKTWLRNRTVLGYMHCATGRFQRKQLASKRGSTARPNRVRRRS